MLPVKASSGGHEYTNDKPKDGETSVKLITLLVKLDKVVD